MCAQSQSDYPQLSLSELSPMTPVPQDHLLVVLKSYFDGGNEADDPTYSHACLATVSGTARQWDRFKRDWTKVLFLHGAKFLHTTDAISLQNDFSRDNGWTRSSVDAFILDCVEVIGKHIEILPGTTKERARAGLHPTTFIIPLADWLRARQECPDLPNTVAELCATESLGFCFKHGRRIGARYYELYFDQGEAFYGHISDRKRNKKARQSMPLLESIIYLSESDMRLVPGLQVADLFAWCINHNHQVMRDWHAALHDLKWNLSLYLDYDRLIKPHPRAIEMTRLMKLPTRQSTETKIEKMSVKRGSPVEIQRIPDNLIPKRKRLE